MKNLLVKFPYIGWALMFIIIMTAIFINNPYITALMLFIGFILCSFIASIGFDYQEKMDREKKDK